MQSSLVGEVEQYLNELGYEDATCLLAMSEVRLSTGSVMLFEDLSNEKMVQLFKMTFTMKYEPSEKQAGVMRINAVNDTGRVKLFSCYIVQENDAQPENGTLIDIYKKCKNMRINLTLLTTEK